MSNTVTFTLKAFLVLANDTPVIRVSTEIIKGNPMYIEANKRAFIKMLKSIKPTFIFFTSEMNEIFIHEITLPK